MTYAKRAHLIIDIQMGCKKPFLEAIGKAVDDIRRDFPEDEIIWVSMSDKIVLSEGHNSGTPAAARPIEELKNFDFIRAAPNRSTPEDEKQITDFMLEHGPLKSETVFCKAGFDAFSDAQMVQDRPELKPHLQNQQPAASKIWEEQNAPSLSEYLKRKGISNISLMGMIATNCVLETAMGAAIKGFNAEIKTDLVVSMDDMNHEKSPDDYKAHINDMLHKILHRPHELEGHGTKHHLSAGDVFSAVDLMKIERSVTIGASALNAPAPFSAPTISAPLQRRP